MKPEKPENERDPLGDLLQGELLAAPTHLRERVLRDVAAEAGQGSEPLLRPALIAAAIVLLGFVATRRADSRLASAFTGPEIDVAEQPAWYQPPARNHWKSIAKHTQETRLVLASLDNTRTIGN